MKARRLPAARRFALRHLHGEMLKAKHDRHQQANNPSTGKKEERDARVDWQTA